MARSQTRPVIHLAPVWSDHAKNNPYNYTKFSIPKPAFLRAWCAVAYGFPGLRPDGYEDEGSGWPRALRQVAAEAWRRAEAWEISDEELYPGDAQWAGLYDRMHEREEDEIDRRFRLAAGHGTPADACRHHNTPAV